MAAASTRTWNSRAASQTIDLRHKLIYSLPEFNATPMARMPSPLLARLEPDQSLPSAAARLETSGISILLVAKTPKSPTTCTLITSNSTQ